MSRPIKLIIALLAAFSPLVTVYAYCSTNQPISVRYPPSLAPPNSADAANVTNWTPPPSPASMYGNWWYTYSSQTAYLSLYNFQQSYYPIILLSNNDSSPSSPQNYDLTSYQLPGNNSHIYTTLGIDTLISSPTDPWHFEYQTVGSYNASDTYDVIAWGYDDVYEGCGCEDTMWFLLYDGAVSGQVSSPPDMAIQSRKAGGPSWDVKQAIVRAIEEQLGDPALTALAKGMKVVPNDGRRDGMLGVVCDGACALDENEPPAS